MNFSEADLHIWRYTVNEKEYDLEKTSPLLSKKEKERCDDYLNEAEKVRYTCNHRFVRQVLAKYLNVQASEIEFSQAAKGKPYLKDPELFFNYSYRSNLAILAISPHNEVGIDIEKMKPLHDLKTFASFSFSENEKKIIFKSHPDQLQETIFTFWTFKEAIIKALGVGLNADLTQIDLSEFYNIETNPLVYANNDIYTIKRLKADEGYKTAIAIKGKLISYKEFNFI